MALKPDRSPRLSAHNPPLAVVIAARNEAEHLPLLLADLQAAPGLVAEVVVVDGGSSDATGAIARAAGARVLPAPACRGAQLAWGAAQTSAPWLLFLHADGRLARQWDQAISAGINRPDAANGPANGQAQQAWYFSLRIDGAGLGYRLLEGAVALRSGWRQLPYGDQGLLIKRATYDSAGGIRPLALMEDLEFVERLRRRGKLRCLGKAITVSGRRWQQRGIWRVCWQNWQLRRAWRRGVASGALAARYYASP
ncbi:TIGR04283 family arsenosugar biosynthesis glycosyltransferase [Cyanobium sp. WAJ14-Wanaka]|uniref:TIGR04283 family arsenosugar biosynthesis glycosyltransferase n=1 Tax=Cyanobium sp. WAJ14-Wanaka TaxID=2823725 RepID=UPI0020CF6C66|nr:TIGR04283 family arsenosugar biosynthesis glycosyltransferase [Cyanobium sp. WAJ14-Wanaka]MCP9774814.1 TIGR04283 family arsenosugar biosynthesis glycosyltransferase [Cyanobium sp. WAJ14-Wanaka]